MMPTMRSPGLRVIAVEADSPLAMVAVTIRVFVDVATGSGVVCATGASVCRPSERVFKKLLAMAYHLMHSIALVPRVSDPFTLFFLQCSPYMLVRPWSIYLFFNNNGYFRRVFER